MALSLDHLDILTFERAEQQAALSKSKGVTTNPHLHSAYFAGSDLADRDAASGKRRTAAEIIEHGLSNSGLPDVDAVSNFVAGYYHRLRWLTKR